MIEEVYFTPAHRWPIVYIIKIIWLAFFKLKLFPNSFTWKSRFHFGKYYLGRNRRLPWCIRRCHRKTFRRRSWRSRCRSSTQRTRNCYCNEKTLGKHRHLRIHSGLNFVVWVNFRNLNTCIFKVLKPGCFDFRPGRAVSVSGHKHLLSLTFENCDWIDYWIYKNKKIN